MDIFNSNEREIRCIRNDSDTLNSKDNSQLEIGRVYHLEAIDVHSWHTDVYLREFPGIDFNSVLFEEIEQQEVN